MAKKVYLRTMLSKLLLPLFLFISITNTNSYLFTGELTETEQESQSESEEKIEKSCEESVLTTAHFQILNSNNGFHFIYYPFFISDYLSELPIKPPIA